MATTRVPISNESNLLYESKLYCPAIHDQVMWWPATLANSTAYMNCSDDNPVLAHRFCLASGEWEGLTNYTACMAESFNDTRTPGPGQRDYTTANNLLMIMFFGSVISDIVLIMSLIVFHIFISQQCQRISIHKNLMASFILRFTVIIVTLEHKVLGHEPWYISAEWLCKSLVTLEQLSYLANFFWMLVEGLYLHIILVLRPLNNDSVPSLLLYVIGWMIPLAIASSWATVMHFKNEKFCWRPFSNLPYIFIIYVPIMLALLVNLLILMNLVRLIIVKLCTGRANEQRRICRTIKSTLVLVFLLGIINLVFITTDGSPQATKIYRYVNVVLPNFQGIVVAVIYCGLNSEVRRAISKRWNRFKDSRNMHSSLHRCRNSRTSVSTFITRTSHGRDSKKNFMEIKALQQPETNGRHSVPELVIDGNQSTETETEIGVDRICLHQ